MKRASKGILTSLVLIGLTRFPLLLAQAGSVTADGFVTETSGNDLQIETLRVRLNQQTRCSKYDDAQAAKRASERVRQIGTLCTDIGLNVGTYVHVVGTRTGAGNLAATQIEVSNPWVLPAVRRAPQPYFFRLIYFLSGGPRKGHLRGAAFLEETPTLIQSNNGPVLRLWINGFPLEATNTDAIRFSPDYLDIQSMSRIGTNNSGAELTLSSPKTFPLVFPSTDKFVPGVYLSYRGTNSTGGRLMANKLTIFPNIITGPDKKQPKAPEPQITEPNYEAHSSGGIRYKYGDTIQIVPDRDIQDYVRNVGMECVPSYQQAMDGSDPAKIKFRFYVVRPFENFRSNGFVQMDDAPPSSIPVGWNGLLSPFILPDDHSRVERIVEMPDGVILIPDVALARLRNKAQLAFALSIAVQSVVQRQEDIASAVLKYGNAYPDSVSYMETMRALRLGIRQMYLAGYDIREAPFTWKYERGEQVANPVINSAHPDSDFPWYAAYAFHYISQYYSDVNYSKLKKGDTEYAQFLDELRKADPEAFEKK